MKEFYLGTWDFPSGNCLMVWLDPARQDGIRSIGYKWERRPPSRQDQEHYREVVAPEIMARVCEYEEIPLSKALFLALEG